MNIWLEIILLAALAVFIFSRLYGILGERRDDDLPPRPNPFATPAPDTTAVPPTMPPIDIEPAHGQPAAEDESQPASIAGMLTRLRQRDPSFDEKDFLSGAREAFKIIVNAYAAGDRNLLAQMLGDKVLADFTAAITSREQNKETLYTNILKVKDVDIESVRLEGTVAILGVRFLSDQINYTTNAAGVVISGQRDVAETLEDQWVFSRNLASTDPNWTLIATSKD